MKVAVVKESRLAERRVALVPESVKRLVAKGLEVVVEAGAGAEASFLDAAYNDAGAAVGSDRAAVVAQADLLAAVNPPSLELVNGLKQGAGLVGLLFPLVNTAVVAAMRERGLSAMALDRIPRITLAQSMDVLSSQSTVAGYRAVTLAAEALPRFFPLLMTAAGRIDPARVLVLGAGVAGLQAIGTARRLGAVVEAYDVRAAVKEQVESLGASFIDVSLEADAEGAGGYAKELGEQEQERINEVIAGRLESNDVCITTALIPGRPAPRLLTAAMVKRMRPGSLVVDLAAEQGGNCELTRPGEKVVVGGVVVLGPANLASDVPYDASRMFSRNVEKLLLYMLSDGRVEYDLEKEIVRGGIVTHEGKVMHEDIEKALAGPGV